MVLPSRAEQRKPNISSVNGPENGRGDQREDPGLPEIKRRTTIIRRIIYQRRSNDKANRIVKKRNNLQSKGIQFCDW